MNYIQYGENLMMRWLWRNKRAFMIQWCTKKMTPCAKKNEPCAKIMTPCAKKRPPVQKKMSLDNLL